MNDQSRHAHLARWLFWPRVSRFTAGVTGVSLVLLFEGHWALSIISSALGWVLDRVGERLAYDWR